MAIWWSGLATRASAERASKWGGIACLIQAARWTIGNIASVSVADKPLDNAIAWFIGASLPPILLVVAGIRLWRSASWIWGSLATLVVALDLALLGPEPTSITTTAALIAKSALLILMVNGVRGALALRKVDYDEEVRRAFS